MALFRIAATSLLSTVLCAQAVPEQSSTHFVGIDSGLVANTAAAPAALGVATVVWSTVVTVPGAAWLRLEYAGVLLAGSSDRGEDGSFLRLTSMLDGAVQTQHLRHVAEWRDTSAYFNGDSVLVELLAQPGTGDNRLMIRNAIAGPANPVLVDTICFGVDDRVLSNDQRVARNQPTGCTSWLINDCQHCLLTAGHCAGSGLQVVEFNVPLSTTNGSLQHPPPSDQYAVDSQSLQTNGGQGVGDDWAYFGVFDNSTTGLSPHQANGGLAFDLATTPPPVSGQNIRITGNGSTSAPVSPTWYLVQKTHAGPYYQRTGTTVRYQTDTTGGNSGSPVILDGTNTAIGIHTHGGCNSSGGSNAGTGSNHAGLQAALANPQGVCYCPTFAYSFPNGLPNAVDPNGDTVRVNISGQIGLVAGTLQMHVSTGGAYQAVNPTALGNGDYDFAIPATTCGTGLTFYFSALGTDANYYYSPANAPISVHSATSALGVTVVRNYDFNTSPPGWTVANTGLSGGAWMRATPSDPQGPSADFDGSGQCYVTGNSSGEDVDGGPTRLTTETIDLGAVLHPVVKFGVWFESVGGTPDDLTIDVSNDGGTTWTNIETISTSTNGWQQRVVDVGALFATPAQFRLRLSVSDQPNDSTTEAAFDAFRVESVQCQAPTWTSFGSGCSAGISAPDLSVLSLPALGSTMLIRATGMGGMPSAMIVGAQPQATPLTIAPFANNCTLLVAPLDVVVRPTSNGVMVWWLVIPNQPSLAGLTIYQQAIEFGAQWTMSQGGVGTVQ
ncbi:MAG TPA: hypothetical protein ENI87_11155 [bacterium]|nr:hypothetical protein [bacterium]